MARIKKFEPGGEFDSLAEVANWCRAGWYVYWRNRLMHGSVFLNQRFKVVADAYRHNQVLKAKFRDEWVQAHADKVLAS